MSLFCTVSDILPPFSAYMIACDLEKSFSSVSITQLKLQTTCTFRFISVSYRNSWRIWEGSYPNTPFTRYNRLSIRLYNRFDNHVERTATVRSTGCQTSLIPVWQPAVYTIQPVVKPVVKRVWQPVECLYTRYNRSSIRFDNQFVQTVVKHLTCCQTGLTTYLTTGCIM